jgi:hypothetical protein
MRLREALTCNHVRAEYPADTYRKLQQHLLAAQAPARRTLARGFYRLVLLDAAAGLDGAGQFVLDLFWRHTARQLVQAFNLDLPVNACGPEDIAQILKDERRSLFCFLNAQLVPEPLLPRLRHFTQEMHQALMLVELSPSPAAEAQLQRTLDELFRLFPQADLAVFLICEQPVGGAEPAEPVLIPRLVQMRRSNLASEEPYSLEAARHCLRYGPAVISEGPPEGARLELSQSIGPIRSRSVMCAPLHSADGRAFGVLQLDTTSRQLPFTAGHLATLTDVAQQAARALDAARDQQEQVTRACLERELHKAREAQSELMTSAVPAVPAVPGYEVFVHAEAVAGGSFQGCVLLAGQRLAVFLGEVAGKGPRAVRLAASLKQGLVAALGTDRAPALVFQDLNTLFHQESDLDTFATCLLGVLEVQRHVLTLVSAAHALPLLRRDAGGTVGPMGNEDAGPPFGVLEGPTYKTISVALAPGDCVILYNSGVSEGRNWTKGSLPTTTDLADAVRAGPASATALGQRLLQSLEAEAAGPLLIDLVLTCLSRNGPSETA